MEETQTVQLRTRHLIASGLKDLFKPPLALLLLIDLLIFGALASVSDQVDDASFFGAILLTVVSAFVQIALTMAAASDEERSSDEWVKLAFKGACSVASSSRASSRSPPCSLAFWRS